MPVNHSELNLLALSSLGFDPRGDAHDFTPNEANLTPEVLTANLATTDMRAAGSVIRIDFNKETGKRADRFTLYLRIREVRKLYEAIDGETRCYSGVPSWYFEAWVDDADFNPPQAKTVRCYVDESGEYGVMQYTAWSSR